jgi:hypothetical protein
MITCFPPEASTEKPGIKIIDTCLPRRSFSGAGGTTDRFDNKLLAKHSAR